MTENTNTNCYSRSSSSTTHSDVDVDDDSICLCVIGTFLGLSIIGTIVLLLWLFSRTHHPKFQVDSFSLSNFTLSRNNSSTISLAPQVQLTARNPNTETSFSFGRVDAVVYYKSRSLASAVMPPFSLGKKRRAPLTASFAAVVVERGSDGNLVGFDVRLLASVRYKDTVCGRRRDHLLTVFCKGLVVRIPSDGSTGGGVLIGGPRPCRVV